MRKACSLLILLCAVLSFSAEKPDCKLSGVETGDGKKIFSQGDKIETTLTYEIPDTLAFAAWRVLSYKPEAPSACEKVFKLSENKDPRWSSYQLAPFVWDAKAENVSPGVWRKKISIDTTNWPEGDYKLSIFVLFRAREKPSTETDVYRSISLNMTIK